MAPFEFEPVVEVAPGFGLELIPGFVSIGKVGGGRLWGEFIRALSSIERVGDGSEGISVD